LGRTELQIRRERLMKIASIKGFSPRIMVLGALLLGLGVSLCLGVQKNFNQGERIGLVLSL
jgi:hypothetical protein